PDNSQSTESIVRLDSSTNRFVGVEVNLGSETDDVFVILFGTAFRNRSSLSAVDVKIGGISAQATYAGPAPGLVALDQLNVRIPRSLMGRGEVDVELTVDGIAANKLKLIIK